LFFVGRWSDSDSSLYVEIAELLSTVVVRRMKP
jgi:hypothetical protein